MQRKQYGLLRATQFQLARNQFIKINPVYWLFRGEKIVGRKKLTGVILLNTNAGIVIEYDIVVVTY